LKIITAAFENKQTW